MTRPDCHAWRSFVMSPSGQSLPRVLRTVLCCGIWAGSPTPGLAAIHVPADYPTISLALANAWAGDSVVVSCGVFDENNLQLRPGVSLLSETGDPACVTIDADDWEWGPILNCLAGSDLTRVEGLTLANGIRALRASGSAVALRGCVFEANYSSFTGGAIFAANSTLTIQDCTFLNNTAGPGDTQSGRGGALYASDSQVYVTDCSFVGNWQQGYDSQSGGGAVYVRNSMLDVASSRFLQNRTCGSEAGGAIYLGSGSIGGIYDTVFDTNNDFAGGSCGGSTIDASSALSLTIEACLMIRAPANRWGPEIRADGYSGLNVSRSTLIALGTNVHAAALVGGGQDPVISNSLFVLSEGVAAYACDAPPPSFLCCDIYAPAGDAWEGCYADQLGMNGNISADPEFCGILGSGNYSLQSDSPCAPENSSCGELIGVLPVGCEGVAAETTSFSAIKAHY